MMREVTKEEAPILRKGDKSDIVEFLQNRLLEEGYYLETDGDFGDETENALKKFQRDWGIEQDGVCGPVTWGTILSTPNWRPL